jgi:lambda repressor-like predicted transcriptional regulator
MQSPDAPPDKLALQVSKRDLQRELWAALRLIDAGHVLAEVERKTGLSRSTLEQALLAAKTRQELIRRHLQARCTLTSLLRYPDRGPWGQARFYGNCTGYLIVDLLDYFQPQSVFDPMEGSGTTGEVCFDLNVEYVGADLRTGFDLLSSPLPDRRFELIFWHPPYWPGHRYSDHPNDFSTARGFLEYLDRLHEGFRRLCDRLSDHGHLILLIGDGRKNSVFYPIHNEIIHWGLLPLDAILIKAGDHERRARHFRYGPTPFIPMLHEYVLVFKGGGS